jgi:hypothetical protein
VRSPLFSCVSCVALLGALGCDPGSVPLDLEVKEGAVAGGNADEIQILAKTAPGTLVKLEGEAKDTGDQATVTFVVPKSKLKLGKNTFTVEAVQESLLGKKTGTATASWDAAPKALLKFHSASVGDPEGELTCGGIMCGTSTFKVTKAGHLPIDVESAITATATLDTQKASVSPGKKSAVDIDVVARLPQMQVGTEELKIPLALEAAGAKATDALDLSGNVLSAVAARFFSGVEKGPVLFAGEATAGAKPDLLVVVGVPSNKLVLVGKPGAYQDVDIVAVAKPVERFFGCGKAEGGAGILYTDLEVTAYDRRTGAKVGTRKLLADRVTCPPTPVGTVKGAVREDDVKKVLADLLGK